MLLIAPETEIGGRFVVVAARGGGGSAQVYLATDATDGAQVALKLFPPSPVSSAEFRREAAIAMRTHHPNLIALKDAGVYEDHPYLALEWVEGPTLRVWLAKGDHAQRETLEIIRQIFAGLDAMHRAGIAHGDIKPDNLILQDGRVRVIDFGRARLQHIFSEGAGMFPGTPAYMHPNLYRGSAPDTRTDCFAAWITAYELLQRRRPFPMATLQWAEEEDLGDFQPASDPDIQRLLHAGLTGALGGARVSWLAVTRLLAGRRDLPRPRPVPTLPAEAEIAPLLYHVNQGRSLALVGDPAVTRPRLEALDRAWRTQGGHALWVHSAWGAADRPLSAALAIAAHAADGLEGHELAEIDAHLGPLGATLASVVPAVRAWTSQPVHLSARPDAERLALALRRLIEAVPQPFLVLVSGLGHVDGSSRRFLGSLVAAGRLTLAGDALPGAPHGMPVEIAVGLPPSPGQMGDLSDLPPVYTDLFSRAVVLDLPFGPLLARAADVDQATVDDVALEAEAEGLARWTGETVVALPSGLRVTPASARAIFAAACRRLTSADADPMLLCRFARLGDDSARLADLIDGAVREAIRLDPAEALTLLDADPRPPNPARVMRQFRVALLARDMRRAEARLAQLRSLEGVSEADLAEAEGDLAFRRGENLTAVAGFERAVKALGHAVPDGILGKLGNYAAYVQLYLGRPPRPRPDPRLGRLFEHLYLLCFCVDHGRLPAILRAWQTHAPQDPHARVVQLVWFTFLRRPRRAAALEARLLAEIAEERDPVGAAVVLLHRGIARSLSGNTVGAFADGVDASERLLRAGDPFLAALATTLPAVCAVHLGTVAPLARLNEGLDALVAATGQRAAAAWARGNAAVISWANGDSEGAMTRVMDWAEESASVRDVNEGLARRFASELHLEQGRWRQARDALEQADAVFVRAGVRMDYAEARWIDLLIADAQARLAGDSFPAQRRRWMARARLLAWMSPRWSPRVQLAAGWQRAAAGDTEGAQRRFEAALADALVREQRQDAWWILHHHALALRDDEVADRAARLAIELDQRNRPDAPPRSWDP